MERPLEGLPPGLRDAVVSHSKLFSLPEQKLNELRPKEMSRVGTPLPDLNLWVEMTLRSGTDAAVFLAEMKHVSNVEVAAFAPLPHHSHRRGFRLTSLGNRATSILPPVALRPVFLGRFQEAMVTV